MTSLQSLTMASEAMPIGGGITVSFTFRAGQMDVSFNRELPKGRKARRYLPAYRLARDEFLRRVSHRTGLTVGVLEI